jgi:zinc transport system substrate-binding protein
MDPHVWLDLGNAARMVDTILAGFVARDPADRSYFETNAAAYRRKLLDLDRRYKSTLGNCGTRTLLHGGHYAFGYLARRYGLDYMAATGVTADSEPTPARLAELVKKVRSLGLKAIFAEELVSPRVAETIADETGAQVLKLHAGHNISRDELARGVTFPLLMEDNLATLAKGLQCRQ